MTLAAFLPISTWDADFIRAIKRHYTGSNGPPPGKKLAWSIFVGGRRVGFIGIGEPAFKLAARRRLGLKDGRPPREPCAALSTGWKLPWPPLATFCASGTPSHRNAGVVATAGHLSTGSRWSGKAQLGT